MGGWRARLAHLPTAASDAGRVELIAQLERLKSAAAAAQARLAAAMADEALACVDSKEGELQAFRSVAGQVGLARRVSPVRGRSLLGLARALCGELPGTLGALAAGEISEWQAILVARETAILSPADRAQVDRLLTDRLGRLGDRSLEQEARRLVDVVDPSVTARRVKRAEADRRVTIRPAPGPEGCAMALLSATMPVAQAVGAYASLRRNAESARGQGDARGIGQLMSDELYARLTAATGAAGDLAANGDGSTGSPNVEVGLVMSERSLLRAGTDPAVLTDEQGRAVATVPAVLARALVRAADRAWLSRLYAHPTSGELIAMDSHRRTFSGRLRKLLVWRDQTCRMPWCEAPVRHADHIRAHAAGGSNELGNGAGLCEACNYLKEAPGWRTEVIAAPGHVIKITTPTGHRYRSEAPRAPGHAPRDLDQELGRYLDDLDDGVDGAA